ncbi:MAG: flagellar basal body P-ring protein FlgI [Phycisphaerales bacterium]|jgi:flagellar P-ring protein precursor FlgI|nr:flagellar basal body P-ring protein FlgI [Phycisphaerales bacterium]
MTRSARIVGWIERSLRGAAGRARGGACAALAAALAVASTGSPMAFAGPTVREIARLEGQVESRLRGIGLVTGLPGTGDSGQELIVARPLMQLLISNGNAPGTIEELAKSKSVALVWVDAVIPKEGGRAGDQFDVSVTTMHSAKSLKGGQLVLSPLREPLGRQEVFGFAAGPLTIEDESVLTNTRVRGGLTLTRDIVIPTVGNSFDLIIEPWFAGYGTASQIASEINDGELRQVPGPNGEDVELVAQAIDDRTVRVRVPEHERASVAAFVAAVQATPVNLDLARLPARVVVNERTGAYVVTGDVTLGPTVITHKDLTITTTVPAPVPTPENPIVESGRHVPLGTELKPAQETRLDDLVRVFKQLNVPTKDQIEILHMLKKNNALHAELIID